MTAVNYTQFRDHMKTYMDKATDNYDPVFITRKENRNVVLMSEEVYNNLLENVYLLGNKANWNRSSSCFPGRQRPTSWWK